jgi:hypothetical protein
VADQTAPAEDGGHLGLNHVEVLAWVERAQSGYKIELAVVCLIVDGG